MRTAMRTIVLLLVLLIPVSGRAISDLDQVRARVFAWREAWLMKDIELYESCYHPAFRSGEQGIGEWLKHKAQLFAKTKTVSVEIFGLSISLQGSQAVARFIQRYRSATLSDFGEKTLALEKLDGSWKIISEHWRKLPENFKLTEQAPGPRPVTKPAGHKKPKPQSPEKPTLPVKPLRRGINYIADGNMSEKVFIRMDRFFIPVVFNLDGTKPRVVIDIHDVTDWKEPARLPTNGALIRQIRSYLHVKQKKLRIVLDLNPSENYFINQSYFKTEHIYCMEIKSQYQ